MAVADDAQLAAPFQTAAGVLKHLPGDMIGNRVLLVERRVAEHRVEAFRLHARQRVIHLKLTAVHRVRQVGFDVQTARSHRHIRLVNKPHLRLRVLRQQRQANYAVAAAEIHHLAFHRFRQVLHKEARADIETRAGKHAGVVVNRPRRTVELPA